MMILLVHLSGRESWPTQYHLLTNRMCNCIIWF
jgi:hypothetical protein